MKFRNLRLATKLGGGFGAVLCIVAATSAFFISKTISITEIERVNDMSDTIVGKIDRVDADLYTARSNVFKYILTSAEVDSKNVQTNIARYKSDMAALRVMLVKDATFLIPQLDQFQTAAESFIQRRLLEELRLASAPATHADAVALVRSSDSVELIAVLTAKYATLRADAEAWSNDLTDKAATAMTEMLMVAIIGGAICIGFGLAMAWLITRAIGRPITAMTMSMKSLAAGDHAVVVPALGQTDEIGDMAQAVQIFKEVLIETVRQEREATEVRQRAEDDRASRETAAAQSANEQSGVVQGLAAGLSKLAAGDLKQRLDQPFAPQYEGLRADFNDAVVKLEGTMQEVLTNTGAIRTGTGEIASASDDLSRRTEQQAASLEQTAAALDEITATVRKTAEGANHARQVVDAARQDAERSGEVVSRAVAAMGGIETSSREIGQIIGVIDEIAFQTNLLALNAGVEAARAGDAGRGFAVVASEVRALAQRSAQAAKEIKTLIMASDRQVKAGVELVGETGQSLTRIVGQVAELNEVVTTIAASAQEQATGLAQVNTAVNQMDQVTQQNAAMVEQSTAAAHSLAQETSALAHLIDRFQVSSGHGQSVGRSSAVVPAKLPAAKISIAKASVAKAAVVNTRPALKVVGTRGVTATAAQDWEEF